MLLVNFQAWRVFQKFGAFHKDAQQEFREEDENENAVDHPKDLTKVEKNWVITEAWYQ